MRCRHCWIAPNFIGEGSLNKKEDVKLKVLLPAIDRAREIGLKHVKLTGGEPFIHDEILDLLYALKERNLGINIETNGTLIGEKQAKAIKESGVKHVSVSVDGPNAELHEEMRGVKGSFKKALKGIECLKNEGMNIQIIMALWQGTKDKILDMARFAKDLGVNSLKVIYISRIGKGGELRKANQALSIKESIECHKIIEKTNFDLNFRVVSSLPMAFKSLNFINKRGVDGSCGVKNLLGILGNGKVSICGIGNQVEELIMGDIHKDDIKDIWDNDPILKRIREDIPDKLEGVCSMCVFKKRCIGYCVAETYFATGSLIKSASFCQAAYDEGLFPSSRMLKPVSPQ